MKQVNRLFSVHLVIINTTHVALVHALIEAPEEKTGRRLSSNTSVDECS